MAQSKTRRKNSIRYEINHLPLFLQVFGIACASMFVPAFYAGLSRDLLAGRSFLYAGLLGLIIFALIAVAMAGQRRRPGALGPLLSLF